MNKYYTVSYDKRAAKYQIYDENGKHTLASNKIEDIDGLQQVEKATSPIVELYTGNTKIGDIVILGERDDAATIAAAEALSKELSK